MFEQTIGVEVEMCRITRVHASQIAAELFGTNETGYYSDQYDTKVAYDSQNRIWKFSSDASIYDDYSHRCELITPILGYDDIPLLQELVRRLRKAGAKSNADKDCGIHVHIGAKYCRAKFFQSMINLMASYEDLIVKSLDLSPSRVSRWCQPVNKWFLENVNEVNPKTKKEIENLWYSQEYCSYSRHIHYHPTRYHMLNLHATFTKGTVEFRMFQFDKPSGDRKNGIHAGQLKAYIQFCLAMFNKAKNEDINYHPVDLTGNLYDKMNNFLDYLGMTGEEFNTAREVFTKKLIVSAEQEIA